jgi:hypothetical protein
MKTIENYQFISNKYNTEEAKEVLKTLYKAIINYHKIENLSSQVKYDVENEKALIAIKNLGEELNELEQTIQVAKLIDKQIVIKSKIEVYYE